MYIVVCTSIED